MGATSLLNVGNRLLGRGRRGQGRPRRRQAASSKAPRHFHVPFFIALHPFSPVSVLRSFGAGWPAEWPPARLPQVSHERSLQRDRRVAQPPARRRFSAPTKGPGRPLLATGLPHRSFAPRRRKLPTRPQLSCSRLRYPNPETPAMRAALTVAFRARGSRRRGRRREPNVAPATVHRRQSPGLGARRLALPAALGLEPIPQLGAVDVQPVSGRHVRAQLQVPVGRPIPGPATPAGPSRWGRRWRRTVSSRPASSPTTRCRPR